MNNLTIKQIELRHGCRITPQPKVIYIEGRAVKKSVYIEIKK